MSFPTSSNDNTGIINPNLLTANPTTHSPIYPPPPMKQQVQEGQPPQYLQGSNNPLAFAPGTEARDPNYIGNLIFNPAQLPGFGHSPPAGAAIPPLVFGPYICPLPHFDLDAIADGLYERKRHFPAPADDNVDQVALEAEEWVKDVRASITHFPDNPTEWQSRMEQAFVLKMRRVEHRDVLVTQVAAEIVRSVIKLHTPEDAGVVSEEGMVEGEDGEMTEGRVDLPAQKAMIGDHLRLDYIQDIQPTVEDYQLTASGRLHRICAVLRQTKGVAIQVFYGKDWIAPLVAAPNRVEAGKYDGQVEQ